ncbi:OLC1v1021481C1 [Oldenlandia corymbosa var. corymbosa]|uniref:OLC1v1021481C1 n=1 Tax=Oldenlandia corymbosa var. corymbosa TaxID=529605 RepID=A0AAV1BVR7_OLDCO|nr:OLC1v1021481C1 [Oldenlandia corymbosa var. corymbosa]
MGIPEVADAARNFAVMVRIQGPDPKGLKMRKHAFHHYNSGKTTLSASGMLLPGFSYCPSEAMEGGDDKDAQSSEDSVLVLTVASLIDPFLSQQHRANLSKDKPQLVHGVQIDIMVEGKQERDGELFTDKRVTSRWLPAELLVMVNIPLSATAMQSLLEGSSGSLEYGWEVGWSLASYASGAQSIVGNSQAQVDQYPFQRHGQTRGLELGNPDILATMTTRMAVLRVSKKLWKVRPKFDTGIGCRKGDLLLAVGSPFGILSPVHFFNCISVGSVSNSHPPASSSMSLLMADIRCLPGMEGCPVFGEQSQLIGVLTRPLRQRTSGAEIQLVIPWEAIAFACSDLLQEEHQLASKGYLCDHGNLNDVGRTPTERLHLTRSLKHINDSLQSGAYLPTLVEKAVRSVCLITVDDGAWASGVLLNKQGLVLTNAHLVEPWRFSKAASAGEVNTEKSKVVSYASKQLNEHCGLTQAQGFLPEELKRVESSLQSAKYEGSRSNLIEVASGNRIRVRLDFMVPWLWVDAKLVYVSKGPLDVALLQLDFIPDQPQPISAQFTCPSPGSKVYVVGHGLFGPRCDFLPSVCRGVVSKVVEASKDDLHQNMEGPFPVMLETTAAVHPGGSGGAILNSDGHMIGLVTSNARHGGGSVIPHLNFSIPCSPLKPIFKFSKDMQDLTILQDLDRPNKDLSAIWALMPPLSPKPGPSLPKLPEFQLENEKDTKGSRFAKFLADRNNLLKDQPGKSLPSKL